MYPPVDGNPGLLAAWLKQTGYARQIERTKNFVVVTFSKYMPTEQLVAIINAAEV